MLPKNREPTHPGEILKEEFLDPMKISQSALAERLDIPLGRLNEIINGRRGISAETAVRLAHFFKTSPQFWMNLQSSLELWKAEREYEAQHAHV